MRIVLTIVLWTVLATSSLAVAARAGLFFLVIALFGRDNPQTTWLRYLEVLAIPPLVAAAMVARSIWSLWLWYRSQWRYAAFAVAFGLAVIAVVIWIETASR